MNGQKWVCCLLLLLAGCLAVRAAVNAVPSTIFLQAQSAHTSDPPVEFVSTEELKAKIIRNEPVTIIDVRSTSSFADSDNTIKGSIHVKLRRLSSRLFLPPLKRVPRDGEVVTYCACPSDESAIEAAKILSQGGFKRVRVLKGGWQKWLSAKGQVTPRLKN